MALFWQYVKIGFEHVVPLGYDHILFICSLFFLNSRLKTALVQCVLFTLAHSCTLALVAMGYLQVAPRLVESVIALSIFLVAFENTLVHTIKPWRLALVFVFGLVHGMGFATALKGVGLPADSFFTALIAFNVGVEIAQIVLILACYYGIAIWARNKPWYQTKLVTPLSMGIAGIALFWAVERFLSD